VHKKKTFFCGGGGSKHWHFLSSLATTRNWSKTPHIFCLTSVLTKLTARIDKVIHKNLTDKY
jgi:hypothetical protein